MDKTTLVAWACALFALGSMAASAMFGARFLGRIGHHLAGIDYALNAHDIDLEKRLAYVEAELRLMQRIDRTEAEFQANCRRQGIDPDDLLESLAQMQRGEGMLLRSAEDDSGDVAVPPKQGEDLGPV